VYVPAVSPEPGRRSLPSAAPLVRLIGFAMAALACVPFLWHALRGSRAYLGFFEDDFFYYVGVADHLVRDGKLSFDGITATNGFHPLWFMIVTALRLVTGGFGAGFFVAMALLISACLAFTAEAVRRFALALGAGPLAAAVLSTWLMLPVTLVGIQGMEVTLATPLLFWFLARVAERGAPKSPRDAVKLGALASLAVLARLDVAILVAVVVAGYAVFARAPWRDKLRVGAWFGLGGAALPVYFGFNLIAFGGLLPLSAAAKQLRTGPGIAWNFWTYALRDSWYGPQAVLMLAAPLAVALAWRKLPGRGAQLAAVGAAAFPLLFYGWNSVACDWAFFHWYAYAIGPGVAITLVGAAALLAPRLRAPSLTRGVAVAGVLVAAYAGAKAANLARLRVTRWTIDDNVLTSTANRLATATRDMPGVYAMGDMAGITTFLLQKPVVQLEGLVADRKMLEHVRRQDPLLDVLREYHVDYLLYVTIHDDLRDAKGCYAVSAPALDESGPLSAKMRANICWAPVIAMDVPAPHKSYGILHAYVWDVRQKPVATR
jgi:hypothetical protein